MNSIYLDNAASTQVAPDVIKAMLPFMKKEYGNPSSLHHFGQKARDALEYARCIIASKINADPSEIIFTSGGTESNNMALRGLTTSTSHIITTPVEHQSILQVCSMLRGTGVRVNYLPVDADGLVLPGADIGNGVTCVSVIHGNNEVGTVNNIAQIGARCRKYGVVFHSDACQSFLREKIDVQRMNIDLMTINGHKIHGPKGVGALYVRHGIKLRSIMYGGGQQHTLRPGTENVPGIVGFAKAVELWKERDNEKMRELRDILMHKLLMIPDARLNGSRIQRLCNNINISFRGIDGESLINHLSNQWVMVSTGSACTSGEIEPSHVLKAIGLPDEWARGTIRLSLSRYTTVREIKKAVRVITDTVEVLRNVKF